MGGSFAQDGEAITLRASESLPAPRGELFFVPGKVETLPRKVNIELILSALAFARSEAFRALRPLRAPIATASRALCGLARVCHGLATARALRIAPHATASSVGDT